MKKINKKKIKIKKIKTSSKEFKSALQAVMQKYKNTLQNLAKR